MNNLLSLLCCAQPVLPAGAARATALTLALPAAAQARHGLAASPVAARQSAGALFGVAGSDVAHWPASSVAPGQLNTDAAIAVTATAGQGLAAPGVAAVGTARQVWWGCSAWPGLWWQLVGQYALERRLVSGSRYRRVAGKGVACHVRRRAEPFSTGLLKHRVFLPGRLSKDAAAWLPSCGTRPRTYARGTRCLRFWKCFSAVSSVNPLAHVLKSDGALLREHVCDEAAVKLHPVSGYCKVLMAEAALLLQSRQFARGEYSRETLAQKTRTLPHGEAVSRRQPDWLWQLRSLPRRSRQLFLSRWAVGRIPRSIDTHRCSHRATGSSGRPRSRRRASLRRSVQGEHHGRGHDDLRSLRKMYNTCLRDPKTAVWPARSW